MSNLVTFVNPATVSSVSAVQALEYFGHGSDGPLSLTNSTFTMSRDMYWTTGVISGTGRVETRGNVMKFSQNLNLENCPVSGIIHASLSNNGGNASGTSGGSAGAAITGTGTPGIGWASPAGVVGGAQSTAGGIGITTSLYFAPYGIAGIGGANESNTAGGALGASSSVTPNTMIVGPNGSLFSLGANTTRPFSGGGGRAGTGGGIGGGGGGGSGGAGTIFIYAKTISRGTGTANGAISITGGSGGNGADGTTSTGQGGGGGGGGAASGGLVCIVHSGLIGTAKSGAIVLTGGNGGNGGAAGGASATSGTSGAGGYGGVLYVQDLLAGTVSITTGAAGTPGTAGSVGGAATTGGTGGVLSATL